ncbi:hypothetical protein H072_4353 [Dactylellina haptotyla CBS 200.50]|uniref:rRNA N-glycosylase n=1 Tax=Dactylellina haptotyla (strain CBS 200.50) TaxID=1284197 RepID=S8AFA0_DACHA|nr:hypothetical protein H072_4353 [Dactylellina haptotyla CBS 200.50]
MRLKYFITYVGVAVSLVHALPGNKGADGGKAAKAKGANAAGTSKNLDGPPEFNPIFTFEFQQGEKGGANYKKSIEEFRDLIAPRENGGPRFLPATSDPPEFFDVLLKTSSEELPVKFRKDNLYLLAYESKTGWKELADSNEISSTKTKFTSHYKDLENFADFEDNGLQGRYNSYVGSEPLESAIRALRYNAKPKEAARAVLVLAHMLPESTRIEEISNYLGDKWSTQKPLPAELIEKENQWTDTDPALLGVAKRQRSNATPKGSVKSKGNMKSKCERGKRDLCIPESEVPKGLMGDKKQSFTGVKPKLSELKAFGGKVSGSVGVLAAVVVTCALSEPSKEEPKRLKKRLDVLDAFLKTPVTVWDGISGGISALFNGGNGDAFLKSANKGIQAVGDLPSDVGEQFQKVWSKENWEALVRSADKGVQAFLDAPSQVADQLPKAWSKENRDTFIKSTRDLVKAIQETPALLECGLYDLREAAEDVVIAFQKAPQQIASELQKFDRGLDGLEPNGKKAFYAITGSLGVFEPSKFDEIGYMAPGICHIVNSIGISKFEKSPVTKCPLVITNRYKRVGEVVRTMFMIHKSAAGSSDEKVAFWNNLDLSIWGKLAYLQLQGVSNPSLKSQSEKAWETVLDGRVPSDLPEVEDEDKLKLWAIIVRGDVETQRKR